MFILLKSKNNIYKVLSIIFFLLTFGVQIISPVIISRLKSTWHDKSITLTKQISENSKKIIQKKENKLFEIYSEIKKYIFANPNVLLTHQDNLASYLKKQYPQETILITDSLGNNAVWFNEINGFPQNNKKYLSEETFFYNSGLNIFLGQVNTFILLKNRYKLFVLISVKRMYRLPHQGANNLSLVEELSERFDTKFLISFSPRLKMIKTAKYFSFPILDKNNRRIGFASFKKPLLSRKVVELKNQLNIAQSIFLIIAIIFLILAILPLILNIKNNIVKVSLIITIIVGMRIILFLLNFPAKIINSGLLDPKYFSSQFANGIVKSPLEFFITGVFTVFGSLVIFYFVKAAANKKKELSGLLKFSIFSIFVLIISLLFIRSLGAMSKSVIFDSSIYYFSDFSLISKPPAILMQINVLLAGFAFFVIIVSANIFLLASVGKGNLKKRKIFFAFFFFLEFGGVIYHFVQPNPQVEIFTRAAILFMLLLITYLTVEKNFSLVKIFVFIAFVASFSTSLLLNHYNTQQEKESLKNIAHDLSRPKGNWYQYLVHQTFDTKSFQLIALGGINGKLKNIGNIAAFNIWSNSLFASETAKIDVRIFDKDFTAMGFFNLGLSKKLLPNYRDFSHNLKAPVFFRKKIHGSNDEQVFGITPLKVEGKVSGYLAITIINEKGINVKNKLPGFLSISAPFVNPAINDQKLSIFELYNSKLVNQSSEVNLSRQNINQILGAKYNNLNEAWINTKLGDKHFTLYAYKPNGNMEDKILVVGVRHKEISFGLFHFFKVFFIHSILIISILIIYILFIIRGKRKMVWSFNAKLFLAFVVISIVPLILLAISIRGLTEEKNNSAIYYKLEKRAKNVEQYLNNYPGKFIDIRTNYYNKASEDLNIDYTIYKNQKIAYSSEMQFYNIGIMHTLISSTAYFAEKNLGLKIFVDKENIGGKKFNSLYYKANIKGANVTIKICDAFNPISLPMSGTELDIFMFGSYSLAVLLIIVFSTLLAKQISSPIRQLTLATKSVAGGDLNLELPQSEKGEVKDLINEFNFMVKELKRSQSVLSEIERETAWKEMAKQVAHEIKNPLTPMKLAVQQLVIAYREKSPKFDRIFDTVTDTIIKQIEILKNIASEFSSFARMPSLKVENIDLITSLKDVKNLFSEEKTEINIITDNNNLLVKADADQLKRTIINLIRNSIQANAKCVDLKTSVEKSFVILKVIDDGQGIPAGKLNKVFDVSFTTKEKGMGLGLSLAKKFIENIGGEITIESTSFQGTTLIIKLPKVL